MENSKHFFSGVALIKVSAAIALLASSVSTAYALDDGRYNIVSSLSGMYLDVYGRSLDDGANVVQYRPTGGMNQQFDVHALGDGTYSIRPAHSGKSLDVFNWNSNDGAELGQWTYTGGNNQRWHIDDAGNGLYSITSAFSGKAVDVSGMSKAMGADVQMYTYWSGGNQLWSFVPVGSTPAPNPSPNPPPDTSPNPSPNPSPNANSSYFVGNITTTGRVRSDFAQYWNQITPENEGKWGSVESSRDAYNWSGLDAVHNYAREHNILFKEHTLIWGGQHPQWIDSLSPSEQAAEIEEWIRDFCGRYPDVDMIDVVNEATPGHAPAGFARSAFGNDWIIKSFQLARKYCPNATLILNDYNVLSWNTDAFIAMAKPAIDAGVVDAIGAQAHGLEDWSNADLERNLNKVAALGLPIYISEYDVARTNDQEQLRILQSQFPMFYNHPSVKGITLWGYVYGKTWVDGSGLIHDNGSARPAMSWLMNYLKEHPKNNGSSDNGSSDNGSSDNQDSTGDLACNLPSKFSWTSTDPLITPHNPNWLSIKDPTIVKYNNKYHVFASIVDKSNNNGYGGVYMNFSDWSQANSAQQINMSTTQAGNTVAPEVFYFEPQKKWYLIYQWGAKYSTNSDISNPSGWSAPKPLLRNGLNNGIDYWVICDDNFCHLFFSGDDGKLYRSKVSIGNFPNFSGYEVVMRDSEVGRLFEASNVYKVDGTNKYLLLVEAYGPRYFRSWTSTSLDGPWTPLADTQSNPFAGAANVRFSGTKWTNDISHGEMIRSGYNQKLTIDPCNMQYLYQGVDPNSGVSDYNSLPWKLGLIKAN